MTCVSFGDLVGSCTHAERELAEATASGDLYAVASAHGHLGVAHHLLGDAGGEGHYALALAAYEEARRALERLGAGPALATARSNLAQLHLRMGDVATARREVIALLAAALAGGRHIDAASVLDLQVLADVEITVGDTAGGLRLLGAIAGDSRFAVPDQEEAARILSRIDLPAEEITRHLVECETLDLEAAVRAVVDAAVP